MWHYVEKFFWVLCGFGALTGAVQFFEAVSRAQSAPQQAAGAGMALCYAVIPYVLARVVEKLGDGPND